jgi:hypothetical protein
MKTLPVAVAAAFAGALIVVACSDDSPHDADAAVCDCPAAEAPITASRVHRVLDVNVSIAPNASGISSAVCPTGEILVSGGCEIAVDNSADRMVLMQSHPFAATAGAPATQWFCSWKNDAGTGAAEVRAVALCLAPAQ